jgi:hypothetical protein
MIGNAVRTGKVEGAKEHYNYNTSNNTNDK